MTVAAAAAYADLTPSVVLDALDAVGLRGDGRVLQLNSFENRVVQVFLDDGTVVVAKFYRPGRWSDAQILEEHDFARDLQASEVPVVAPIVFASASESVQLLGTPPTLARWGQGISAHRFAVAPRCGGREIEIEDLAALSRLGRFLGRLHNVGAERRFGERLTLDAPADARRAIQTVLGGPFLPPELAATWSDAAARVADRLAAAFEARPPQLLRIHGDCHHGNVLWRHDGEVPGPHIVDLDDAINGPAVQDLWMLAAGDADTTPLRFAALLAGYEQMRRFDRAELTLVEPLRALRILRHSAWIAERWQDPAFPAAFPFFGSAAYWQQQVQHLREQLEAMDEPPLRV